MRALDTTLNRPIVLRAKVRDAFRRARAALPAIIFFDELDAVATSRDVGGGGSGGSVEARVLSTLLNEMDGIESADGLLVIGATNAPNVRGRRR